MTKQDMIDQIFALAEEDTDLQQDINGTDGIEDALMMVLRFAPKPFVAKMLKRMEAHLEESRKEFGVKDDNTASWGYPEPEYSTHGW